MLNLVLYNKVVLLRYCGIGCLPLCPMARGLYTTMGISSYTTIENTSKGLFFFRLIIVLKIQKAANKVT